jgi:hypothetical protein
LGSLLGHTIGPVKPNCVERLTWMMLGSKKFSPFVLKVNVPTWATSLLVFRGEKPFSK